MLDVVENTARSEPKGKAARTLESILSMAIECYETFGLEGTTLELIAERTDISRATVYRHVKNRRELLTKVFDRDAEDAMQQLVATVSYEGSLSDMLIEGILFLSGRRQYYAMQIVMDIQDDGFIKGQGVPMSLLASYAEYFLAGPFEEAKSAGDIPDGLTLSFLCDWVGRLMRSLLVDPPAVVNTKDEYRQYLQVLLAPVFSK